MSRKQVADLVWGNSFGEWSSRLGLTPAQAEEVAHYKEQAARVHSLQVFSTHTSWIATYPGPGVLISACSKPSSLRYAARLAKEGILWPVVHSCPKKSRVWWAQVRAGTPENTLVIDDDPVVCQTACSQGLQVLQVHHSA